jgi:hypothetical protein
MHAWPSLQVPQQSARPHVPAGRLRDVNEEIGNLKLIAALSSRTVRAEHKASDVN